MFVSLLLFVAAVWRSADGAGLDMFGIENYVGALGIKGGANNFLQCQRKGVSEQCARQVLSGSQLGGALGVLGGFGLDSNAIADNIQVCKNKDSEKAESIKDWLDLLNQGGFGAALERACKQQICDELRKCEETVKTMCDLMQSLNGGFSLATMQSLMESLGGQVQKSGARTTVQDSCEKIAEIAENRRNGQSQGNIFQDFLGIGARGVGSQVAGKTISNPGAAAQGLGLGAGGARGGGLGGLGGLLKGGQALGGLGLLGGGKRK